MTSEISGIKEAMTVLQQQPSLHLLRQLSLQQRSSQQPSSEQPSADQSASEQPSTAGAPAPAPSHPPLNTLSITDIIAQSYDALGLQSPLTPLTPHTRERQAGLLDALLLDAASSARPELVVTNPVYLDGDLQASVSPTPIAAAPSQAVLHQVGNTNLHTETTLLHSSNPACQQPNSNSTVPSSKECTYIFLTDHSCMPVL